jgi:hypothetical protein
LRGAKWRGKGPDEGERKRKEGVVLSPGKEREKEKRRRKYRRERGREREERKKRKKRRGIKEGKEERDNSDFGINPNFFL